MQKITLSKSFKTNGLSKVVVCSLTTGTDAVEKRGIVAKMMKAWEAKATKRAANATGFTLMAVSLAACNDDSVGPVIDTGDNPTNVTPGAQATLSNDNAAVEVQGVAAGAVIEISDITTDSLEAVIAATGAEAEGDTLTFNFADSDDLVILGDDSSIEGFSVVRVVSGTVDFSALDAGMLEGVSIEIGSGAIVSAEQFLSLAAVVVREGAVSGELAIAFKAGDDVDAVLGKLSELDIEDGIALQVAAADGSLTADQITSITAAGAEVADETGEGVPVPAIPSPPTLYAFMQANELCIVKPSRGTKGRFADFIIMMPRPRFPVRR